jgi:predicted transcriptional regulator
MNERIRQLARDSYMVEVVCSQKSVKVNYPKNFEKFAELIVKECIECADIVGKANLATAYPNSTAHHVKQKIREHFGVEL